MRGDTNITKGFFFTFIKIRIMGIVVNFGLLFDDMSLLLEKRVFLSLLRANSRSLTRVARMEWGQSEGPLVWETPRAILLRRLEGGMGPLKGVTRCAGSASKVYIREYEEKRIGKKR